VEGLFCGGSFLWRVFFVEGLFRFRFRFRVRFRVRVRVRFHIY
jgi:hypothetical protein